MSTEATDEKVSTQQKEKVVILLHGIRTRAHWQTDIAPLFAEKARAKVFTIKYGRFDLIRFLLPIPDFRNGPLNIIRDELDLIQRNFPDAERTVIAHSFGTYCLAKLMDRYRQLRFSRVILCGSVVESKHNWSSILEKSESPFGKDQLINEVGSHDVWPVLARSLTWGYGSTGTFGFGRASVVDRHHALGHSGFLTRDFARKYWLPLLMGKEPRHAPVTHKPKWLEILALPWKYLIVMVIAGILAKASLHLVSGVTPYLSKPIAVLVEAPEVVSGTFDPGVETQMLNLAADYQSDMFELLPQDGSIHFEREYVQTPRSVLMLKTKFTCSPEQVRQKKLEEGDELAHGVFGFGGADYPNCDIIGLLSELQDNHGRTIARSETHIHFLLLKISRNYLPLAVLQQLGLDRNSAKYIPPPTKVLTLNAFALANFLMALDWLAVSEPKKAENSLRLAIEVDPKFATAMWLLGEVKKNDDPEAAGKLQDQALKIDPDLSKVTIPNLRPDPVPLLLAKSRGSTWTRLSPFSEILSLTLEKPETLVVAVRIERAKGTFSLVATDDAKGSYVERLRELAKADVAINAGYFHLENGLRSPAGLLRIGRVDIGERNEEGPRGGIAIKDGEIRLEWLANIDADSNDDVLQVGPFLVDPGGEIGIKEAASKAIARRSAVCTTDQYVTFVYVGGEGVTLREFSRILSRKQGIYDCERALYLDGGPSSQLSYAGRYIEGGWEVYSALTWKESR